MDAFPLPRVDVTKTYRGEFSRPGSNRSGGAMHHLMHGHAQYHMVQGCGMGITPTSSEFLSFHLCSASILPWATKVRQVIQPIASCGLLVFETYVRKGKIHITFCFFARVKDTLRIKHLFGFRKQLYHFFAKHIF